MLRKPHISTDQETTLSSTSYAYSVTYGMLPCGNGELTQDRHTARRTRTLPARTTAQAHNIHAQTPVSAWKHGHCQGSRSRPRSRPRADATAKQRAERAQTSSHAAAAGGRPSTGPRRHWSRGVRRRSHGAENSYSAQSAHDRKDSAPRRTCHEDVSPPAHSAR